MASKTTWWIGTPITKFGKMSGLRYFSEWVKLPHITAEQSDWPMGKATTF